MTRRLGTARVWNGLGACLIVLSVAAGPYAMARGDESAHAAPRSMVIGSPPAARAAASASAQTINPPDPSALPPGAVLYQGSAGPIGCIPCDGKFRLLHPTDGGVLADALGGSAEAKQAMAFPTGGVISEFGVKLTSADGGKWTFSLHANGNTYLASCHVPQRATQCKGKGVAPVNAGDRIAVVVGNPGDPITQGEFSASWWIVLSGANNDCEIAGRVTFAATADIVVHDERGRTRQIKSGDAVCRGWSVFTQGRSEAAFVFDEDAGLTVRLGPHTELRIGTESFAGRVHLPYGSVMVDHQPAAPSAIGSDDGVLLQPLPGEPRESRVRPPREVPPAGVDITGETIPPSPTTTEPGPDLLDGFNVTTPGGEVHAQGTNFSVAYDRDTGETTVLAAEGAITVDPEGPQTAIPVPVGTAVAVNEGKVRTISVSDAEAKIAAVSDSDDGQGSKLPIAVGAVALLAAALGLGTVVRRRRARPSAP